MWVVNPSAAMAIASIQVSAVIRCFTSVAGIRLNEFSPATAINSTANQGMVMADFSAFSPLLSVLRLRLINPESTTRKGASIITRIILEITAAFSASGPMACPAATTCATSWMVEPVKIPKLS
ncbi:hypothetical protein D3C78_1561320 [compost metagenome]